jgi:hypothetical protein
MNLPRRDVRGVGSAQCPQWVENGHSAGQTTKTYSDAATSQTEAVFGWIGACPARAQPQVNRLPKDSGCKIKWNQAAAPLG